MLERPFDLQIGLIGVVEVRQDLRVLASQRSIGSCVENERHDRSAAPHRRAFDAYPGGEFIAFEVRGAAVVLASDTHLNSHATSLRDDQLGSHIPGELHCSGGGLRHYWLHLNTVGVARPAALQVVLNENRVLAVSRTLPADVAVGPATVVISDESGSIGVADIHHGIDRGPQTTAVEFDLKDLTLLGGEFEVVLIALCLQHTVEGGRSFNCRQACYGIVVLSFHHIRQRRDAEPHGRCRCARRIGDINGKVFGGVGRNGDVLFVDTGHVTEELDLHGFAGFATRGNDAAGAGIRADVEQVVGLAIAQVGRIANLDDVLSVFRNHARRDTIVPGQSGVVTGGQLKSSGVQDRDVGIKEVSPRREAEADSVSFGGEPFPLLAVDDVVVDIFAINASMDTVVVGDGLGCGELGVRLDLFGHRQRADIDIQQVRQTALGP